MNRRHRIGLAVATALFLAACGGGLDADPNMGACVVDGTRSCTENVNVRVCQAYLHGDHFYESRTCRDVGFPK
jgi:hypothetical protein